MSIVLTALSKLFKLIGAQRLIRIFLRSAMLAASACVIGIRIDFLLALLVLRVALVFFSNMVSTSPVMIFVCRTSTRPAPLLLLPINSLIQKAK